MINELKQGFVDTASKTITLIMSEFPNANPVTVKEFVKFYWERALNNPNNPDCFYNVSNIVEKFRDQYDASLKSQT